MSLVSAFPQLLTPLLSESQTSDTENALEGLQQKQCPRLQVELQQLQQPVSGTSTASTSLDALLQASDPTIYQAFLMLVWPNALQTVGAAKCPPLACEASTSKPVARRTKGAAVFTMPTRTGAAQPCSRRLPLLHANADAYDVDAPSQPMQAQIPQEPHAPSNDPGSAQQPPRLYAMAYWRRRSTRTLAVAWLLWSLVLAVAYAVFLLAGVTPQLMVIYPPLIAELVLPTLLLFFAVATAARAALLYLNPLCDKSDYLKSCDQSRKAIGPVFTYGLRSAIASALLLLAYVVPLVFSFGAPWLQDTSDLLELLGRISLANANLDYQDLSSFARGVIRAAFAVSLLGAVGSHASLGFVMALNARAARMLLRNAVAAKPGLGGVALYI